MEVARSIRFLGSTILFSLTSDYERTLKKELFMCCKNMKIQYSEILRMTVADRRTFAALHNREVKREKKEMDKMMSKAKR